MRSVRKKPATGLESVLESYLNTHSVCREHATNMRLVVRRMKESGISQTRHLSSSSVTRFLSSLTGRSPFTVAGHRRIAMALWRHAVESGVAVGPVACRPVRTTLPPVRAWTLEQTSTLVKSARLATGKFRKSGCPASAFFAAFVLLGYETGVRLGDLHGMRIASFSTDFASVQLVTNKTGVPLWRTLSPDCASACRNLASLSPDGTMFFWALSRRFVKLKFRALCRSCGLEGSAKWLRRTGATHTEAQTPGAAGRFCGHLTASVAPRHYVDWSQVQAAPTAPRLRLD